VTKHDDVVELHVVGPDESRPREVGVVVGLLGIDLLLPVSAGLLPVAVVEPDGEPVGRERRALDARR
jgi:hypothetical protein